MNNHETLKKIQGNINRLEKDRIALTHELNEVSTVLKYLKQAEEKLLLELYPENKVKKVTHRSIKSRKPTSIEKDMEQLINQLSIDELKALIKR